MARKKIRIKAKSVEEALKKLDTKKVINVGGGKFESSEGFTERAKEAKSRRETPGKGFVETRTKELPPKKLEAPVTTSLVDPEKSLLERINEVKTIEEGGLSETGTLTGDIGVGVERFFKSPTAQFITAGLGIGGVGGKVGGVVSKIKTLRGAGKAVGIAKRIDVDVVGKQLGFTADQTAALAKEIGRQRVTLVARDLLQFPNSAKIGQMAVNRKSIGLSKNYLSRAFSIKTMALFGAWASSVFLGRWAKAEAPEGIMIPLRDAIKQAEITGDWSTVDEYTRAAAEITDTSTWEQILLWSPFSAVVGISKKIEGVANGVLLLSAIAEEAKSIQATEEVEGSTFEQERKEAEIGKRERDIRMSEVFALRREGRFEDADALEQEILKHLKGG